MVDWGSVFTGFFSLDNISVTENVLIVGSGGHARVVLDACKRWACINIIGILDDFKGPGNRVNDVPVLGSVDWYCEHIIDEPHYVFIAVGDNDARMCIVKRLPPNTIYATVSHPTATIAGELGQGVYVGAGAYVGPDTRLCDFSILNTNASLDHDGRLGMFSHMAPNSCAAGRVKIGNHTMIGIGACIRDGITIGDGCTIGMGSVVTKSIPDNQKGWGSPWKSQAK